jgi:hypothetical protein
MVRHDYHKKIPPKTEFFISKYYLTGFQKTKKFCDQRDSIRQDMTHFCNTSFLVSIKSPAFKRQK